MTDEEFKQDSLGEYRKFVSQKDAKSGHAKTLLATKEQSEAFTRQRVREDPNYAKIVEMRMRKKRASNFLASHGPDAVNFLPDDLLSALFWVDPDLDD